MEQNTSSQTFQPSEIIKAKWTFDDVINALGFIALPTHRPVAGFALDSRNVQPGQIFLALKGERQDGHDYVTQAFEKGAFAAIVERGDLPALEGKSFLRVEDAQEALNRLGRYARERSGATVVAISGSVGKTTVRLWTAQLLAALGDVATNPHNYNGQIGLPLSLTELGEETAFGVFEVGIDQPGTMATLSKLCRPHVAVLTPIAAAHIENFASLKELAQEKAQLCVGLEPHGVLVVDQASLLAFPCIREVAEAQSVEEIVSVGFEPGATVRILSMEAIPEEDVTSVELDLAGLPVRYELNLRGRAAVLDSALALAATLVAAYEGKLKEIVQTKKEELSSMFLSRMLCLKLAPGRGATTIIRTTDGRKITLIDDAYNANPASMLAGIERLSATPALRHVAVLGDMLALGEKSDAAHDALFRALAKKAPGSRTNLKGMQEKVEEAELRRSAIDKVYVVGEACKRAYRLLEPRQRGGYAETVEALVPLLQDGLRSGDVVWIKGSHDTGLCRVAALLRNLFQDEVVEEAA